MVGPKMLWLLRACVAISIFVGLVAAVVGQSVICEASPWVVELPYLSLGGEFLLLYFLRRPSRRVYQLGAVCYMIQIPALTVAQCRYNTGWGFALSLRLSDPPLPVLEINLYAVVCVLFFMGAARRTADVGRVGVEPADR